MPDPLTAPRILQVRPQLAADLLTWVTPSTAPSATDDAPAAAAAASDDDAPTNAVAGDAAAPGPRGLEDAAPGPRGLEDAAALDGLLLLDRAFSAGLQVI